MDKIRDLREKFFQVDDEYLNGYAKLCGINATGVYLSLCRHANKEQRCFPSKKLIATELAISERSVYRALEILESWNIVRKEGQGRKSDGSYRNTLYTLFDKSSWKPKPSATQSLGSRLPPEHPPSATQSVDRLPQVPNKETHINHTHNKDSAANAAPEVFSLKAEIEKLYENTRRDLNIIGWYFEKRKPDIRDKEQLLVSIRRHVRAAQLLSPFADDQIGKAYRYVAAEYPEWTLETLVKKLSK